MRLLTVMLTLTIRAATSGGKHAEVDPPVATAEASTERSLDNARMRADLRQGTIMRQHTS